MTQEPGGAVRIERTFDVFTESEGSTTVLMVNSGISTDERRDAQDGGWHGYFDESERVVAG